MNRNSTGLDSRVDLGRGLTEVGSGMRRRFRGDIITISKYRFQIQDFRSQIAVIRSESNFQIG
jgi:hypothetical protein